MDNKILVIYSRFENSQKASLKNLITSLSASMRIKSQGRLINAHHSKKMMDLVRAGGIDLIVTKSISRFGRNAINVIGAIQELKKIGIEIYFD